MTSMRVEASVCSGCGTCCSDCPTSAIVLEVTRTACIEAERCIDCGHCGAVCTTGAITSSIGPFEPWQAPKFDPQAAMAFLAGRRSVRRYKPISVRREAISEVLGIAAYAPTASNARDVQAHVFIEDQVFVLAKLVNDYYCWFDGILKRRWLWPLLYFTAARPYLGNPRKLRSIREKIARFDRERDWIFFGAPAVVLLTAPSLNRSFGRVDCVIAAERVMQYAAALGLGSCWIGYAEVAMRRRKSIAQAMGVPADQEPQAIFTLGYPASHYRHLPARRPIPVTWQPAAP